MEDASAALIAQTLGSINERMQSVDGKLDTLIAVTSDHTPRIQALERNVEDHSQRIRDLEEARWTRAGVAALVTASTGIVVAVAAVASGHPASIFG